jgi:hypothetical protein
VTYTLTPSSETPGNYDLTITYADMTSTTISDIPAENVLTNTTGPNGTLNLASLLSNNVYVIPPGVDGTVDLAVTALSTNTIYVGGNATISSTVSALTGITINVDGGSATVASSAVLGALSGVDINLDNGGIFSNGAGLITALNGSTINFGAGGGVFIANGNGNVINLSSTTINGFNADIDKIEFENVLGTPSSYTISTSGNSQIITLYDSSNNEIGTTTVAKTGAGLATGTFSASGSGPLAVSDFNGNVTIDPNNNPCFAAGTLILTPDGERFVETLKTGDAVITADGSTAPIIFIGHRLIHLARHRRPHTVRPVRIRAGALADGIPQRDLLLSPDHALFLEDVLVPARDLVDGISITQESNFRDVHYYHIELPQHGIIFAEGAPAESFLNVGHRGMFDNSGEPVMLHPEAMHAERARGSCAPLVFSGEKLAQIRTRLRERVTNHGYHVSQLPILSLKIGERELLPSLSPNGRALFTLPPGTTQAVLRSPVFTPAEIDPGSADRRRLGLAITDVEVDDCPVELDAALNAADMHPRGAGEHASWSRGDVRITLPEGAESFMVRIVGWPSAWKNIRRAA